MIIIKGSTGSGQSSINDSEVLANSTTTDKVKWCTNIAAMKNLLNGSEMCYMLYGFVYVSPKIIGDKT